MDAAEEVKSRLDIVDVVQEYLPLKPAGTGSFKGLCPFHQEKTPSFYVNRPRQSWHCFGCDQGGDSLSFVMQMESIEFREALELLAQKAGIALPAFNPEQSSERRRLLEANDLTSRWFRSMLLTAPDAEHARAYAAKREIDDLTGDVWRIGYAPNSWSALTEALKSKGVTEQELLKAGLVGKREQGSGVYDRFRDRLMFTICDVHGAVVGFTGRILNDSTKEAKYVNTPETMLYKKSSVLYGLAAAKGEIKRRNQVVIVEGNMDVVSSHRVGITNVVASSGTALTHEQLRLLKRFTTNLVIAFDQDAAGNAATLRGLDLARALDFNISILQLPPQAGKDPDDAIRKDIRLWKDAITNSQSIVEWLYQKAFRGKDISRPEEKKIIAQELIPEFSRIADSVEREGWISRLAKDLAIPEETLREVLRTKGKASIAGPLTENLLEKKAEKSAEEHVLERLQALLVIAPEHMPLARSILQEYCVPEVTADDLLNYLTIFADREFEDRSSQALAREVTLTAARLRDAYRTKERQRLEQEMRDAERVGDHEKIHILLTQFQKLSDADSERPAYATYEKESSQTRS